MIERPGKLFFTEALTAAGWRRDVLVGVEGGSIVSVEAAASPPAGAERYAGAAIPGLGNVHSHAFQRAMAGLAERGGSRDGVFWSWREVMYRLVAALTPEDIETVTALAFMEMLESGFTAVGEFHYLHNEADGTPYGDPALLSRHIAAAAAETGIGLTLLPVFYAHGGAGGVPPESGQRRFVTSRDAFARLVEGAREAIHDLEDARMGVAPHSLRAVTSEELHAVLLLAGDAPIHIHAAEQEREVAECVAALGARPVEWLLANAAVDGRWCLVHATQMTEAETEALARSGAVAGLCPVTEANLGDGIFPLPDYLAAGGRLGIGTDSNVAISAPQELRLLEYSQRLRDRARNRAASVDRSTGRRLFDLAAAGGVAALGRASGAIEPGRRADIVVLDTDDPALCGRGGDALLDSWVFGTGAGAAVRDVLVGGRPVVSAGRHRHRDAIVERWRRCAGRLGQRI
ncbi:MAG TPA: formimidoylglutamate deiminase [Stellaceae bacterium]|nr:formimidoylglutamate deiminase [Stellaceae bacterium]